MAKVTKEEVKAEEPTIGTDGRTEAQKYKAEQVKSKAEAEIAKREEVLKKVKALDYKPDLCGTFILFTEKSGVVSPGMIIAERFATVEGELKMILSVYVFSPRTAQPYKAELTY